MPNCYPLSVHYDEHRPTTTLSQQQLLARIHLQTTQENWLNGTSALPLADTPPPRDSPPGIRQNNGAMIKHQAQISLKKSQACPHKPCKR